MPDGMGDRAYLDQLNAVLPRLIEAGRPDLVFYNAGVDPHMDDRLGRMKMTDQGLEWRERTVIDFFRSRHIPLCGVIGGGYSYDAAAVAKRHVTLFRVGAEFSDG
ncbi:hypothetical protein GCM10010136_33150 [Limoniibacter endophyticus]|uniref:Histone deacetylase domain-containing protein n=1 Tax=Limoniibacter endophyticus TaxID=1565040 RepID=A0A8J3GJT1_9HYPH|nr:hypothetical protein GCM10010136_33150 [Limoniibacter endophyticus]